MTDIEKELRHIALRKRDEKAEEGIAVSEKSFKEWQAANEIERLRAALYERNELLTHWEHCLSSFYGNNIIDSVRRAMRCVRDGKRIPRPWEPRPDASNEMTMLKQENERLRAALERIATGAGTDDDELGALHYDDLAAIAREALKDA